MLEPTSGFDHFIFPLNFDDFPCNVTVIVTMLDSVFERPHFTSTLLEQTKSKTENCLSNIKFCSYRAEYNHWRCSST